MATKTFKIGLSATEKQNMAQDIYERVLALTFAEYDSSETYNTGDFVVYNDALYQCKEDNVTGTWDSSKWQSATLQDLLDDVEGAVASVSGKANTIDLLNGTLVPTKSLVSEQIENVSEDSGTTQDNPFTFQATATNGGAGASDTAPTAKYLKLKGKTYCFNQLVGADTSLLTLTNGHKYLTKIGGNAEIVNGTGQSISVTGGTDQVFDLTRLFNGDIPEEITNGVSLPDYDLTFTGVDIFNQLFPLPYYSYNAGTLVSANATKLTTLGKNQFYGILEGGYIDSSGVEQSSANSCRSENYFKVIPSQVYMLSSELNENHKYIIEYDFNKQFIKSQNGTEKLTSNTHYVRFYFQKDASGWGTNVPSQETAKIQLFVAWLEDGTTSRPDFEEYVKHEYALGSELEEHPLLSAGEACDIKLPDGTITRKIGFVDLGTLDENVFYINANNVCQISVLSLGCKPNTDYNLKYNLLCNKYVTDTYNNVYSVASKNTIAFVNNSIAIQDDAMSGMTKAQAKAYLSGVYVYFELATPTPEQGDSFPAVVEVDDFGTMEYGGTNYNGYPQGCEFFYQADYVLFIDTLGNGVNWEAGDIAKNSELNSKFETYLKSLTGYDNTKTQTLKNVSGTLTWVDD